MKTLITLFITLVVVQSTNAQTSGFSDEKKSVVVGNLTVGIESPNTGLHTSAALVLSDLISQSYLESNDASQAMIPLIAILKKGNTDEERIAAAFALYKLDNAVAIYQLRGVAVFDDNIKVATICKNLYYSYHKLHRTEYLVSL